MAAWRRAAAELRPPRAGLTPSRAPAALYPVEEHAEDERGGEVGGRVQRGPEGEGGEDLVMGRGGVGVRVRVRLRLRLRVKVKVRVG